MLNFLCKWGIEKIISKELVKMVLMAVIKEVFSYDDRLIDLIVRKLNILSDKLHLKLMQEVKSI